MRGTPLILKEFHGVNLADDPLDLPWGVAQSLSNVEPNGKSGLHRREALQEAYVLGSIEQLYHGLFATAYYSQATAFGQVGGAAFSTGLTPATKVGCVAPKTVAGLASAFYMTDQTNTPKYWDGTTLTNWVATTGTVPKCTKLIYAGGRMIAADILGQPTSQVQASTPGDPFGWGTAVGQGWQVLLDSADDAGGIQGLMAVGPYVLVFKQQKIHVIYDLDTGANRLLTDRHGIPGYSAQVRYLVGDGNRCYFYNLHDSHVWETDGNTLRKLSGALGPLGVASMIPSGAGVPGYLALNQNFLLVTSTSGYMWVMDLETGEWWYHSTPGVNGFGPAMGMDWSGGAYAHYFLISYRAGAVCIWTPNHSPFTPTVTTDGTTGATAFSSSWTAGVQDFGRPSIGKRLRYVEAVGSVAAGALSLAADRDGTAVAARSFGLGASRSVKKIPTWGVGKLWTPSLSDTTTSRWSIDELEFDWQPRRG